MPILSLLLTTRSRLLSAISSARYYAADGTLPTLIIDVENNFYATRTLDGTDYAAGDTLPTLVIDMENSFYATRTLDQTDYAADDTSPTLVIDVENNFYTVEN